MGEKYWLLQTASLKVHWVVVKFYTVNAFYSKKMNIFVVSTELLQNKRGRLEIFLQDFQIASVRVQIVLIRDDYKMVI